MLINVLNYFYYYFACQCQFGNTNPLEFFQSAHFLAQLAHPASQIRRICTRNRYICNTVTFFFPVVSGRLIRRVNRIATRLIFPIISFSRKYVIRDVSANPKSLSLKQTWLSMHRACCEIVGSATVSLLTGVRNCRR